MHVFVDVSTHRPNKRSPCIRGREKHVEQRADEDEWEAGLFHHLEQQPPRLVDKLAGEPEQLAVKGLGPASLLPNPAL